jgi:nanoRNase/pAp phosphatase (c-di-AMP/oligoRNAs hydrolase)
LDVKKSSPTPRKLAQLLELMADTSTMLIVLQDNPDPDAIASAMALRHLARTQADIQSSIAHGGIVGRAENLAMLRYLDLHLHPLSHIHFDRFDLVAAVDTQPGAGNNSLPPSILPDIVIDHHPIRRPTHLALFKDIRSRYGATSTILYEYLCAAGIRPDLTLATALAYGIRSDTHELGRETTQADVAAYLALYPMANPRALSRIERGRVPPVYFAMLARAIQNARRFGNRMVTRIGQTHNPDMIGEVADLLLRCEGMDWVLCQGIFGKRALFSIRTSDPSANAGRVAHQVAGQRGSGGGHTVLAAGQIPLATGTREERRAVEEFIVQRFLRATGGGHLSPPVPLVP